MDFAGYCHAARRLRCRPRTRRRTSPIAARSTDPPTGQAATLDTSLGPARPDGYTPTGPALKGAIQYAQQYAQRPRGPQARGRPGDRRPAARRSPTTSTRPPASSTRASRAPSATRATSPASPASPRPARRGAAGTPAVPTFVIGVASQVELSSIGEQAGPDRDGQVGTATGNPDRHQPGREPAAADEARGDSNQGDRLRVQAAGRRASTSRRSTSASPAGAGADTAIGHAPIDGTSGAGCDARGGWYYDKDPATRHADQDHRLPGDLLDVPDGPERPRQRRPRLPDHRRRVAPAVAAPQQRRDSSAARFSRYA